jgi:hypothetical protein
MFIFFLLCWVFNGKTIPMSHYITSDEIEFQGLFNGPKNHKKSPNSVGMPDSPSAAKH